MIRLLFVSILLCSTLAVGCAQSLEWNINLTRDDTNNEAAGSYDDLTPAWVNGSVGFVVHKPIYRSFGLQSGLTLRTRGPLEYTEFASTNGSITRYNLIQGFVGRFPTGYRSRGFDKSMDKKIPNSWMLELHVRPEYTVTINQYNKISISFGGFAGVLLNRNALTLYPDDYSDSIIEQIIAFTAGTATGTYPTRSELEEIYDPIVYNPFDLGLAGGVAYSRLVGSRINFGARLDFQKSALKVMKTTIYRTTANNPRWHTWSFGLTVSYQL